MPLCSRGALSGLSSPKYSVWLPGLLAKGHMP